MSLFQYSFIFVIISCIVKKIPKSVKMSENNYLNQVDLMIMLFMNVRDEGERGRGCPGWARFCF